jgi:hypothetical protein
MDAKVPPGPGRSVVSTLPGMLSSAAPQPGQKRAASALLRPQR